MSRADVLGLMQPEYDTLSNLQAANTPDPSLYTGNVTLPASTVMVIKLFATKPLSVTSLVTMGYTGGSALTGFYVALFSATGTLLAGSGSADISSTFTGNTNVANFGSVTAVPTGLFYAAIQTGTASTMPALCCSTQSSTNRLNTGVSGGTAAGITSPRWSTAANAWSSATPPATLGALSVDYRGIFVGVR